MREGFGETVTKLPRVREWFDSLMVQFEYTLECRSIPLQAYIGRDDNTIRLLLHIGEREEKLPRQISYVGHDFEMRQHELHKAKCSQVGIAVFMVTHAFNLSLMVGWCEILIWYPV